MRMIKYIKKCCETLHVLISVSDERINRKLRYEVDSLSPLITYLTAIVVFPYIQPYLLILMT